MNEELLFKSLEQIGLLADRGVSPVSFRGTKKICFSGGEPFLFYDLLKSGLAKAKELGFSTEVCTNGFWGNWADSRITDALQTLPLDCLTISTDYFHEKFVSDSAILNLMKFVKRSGVKCTIRIGETSDAAASDFIVKMGAYKYMTNLVIYPFMKIGRAASMGGEKFFRLRDVSEAKCPARGSVAVRFDGEVFFCAGPAWTNDAMSFGNIADASLSDILNGERAKEFSSVFAQKGALSKAARIAGSLCVSGLPDRCAGACEICLALFSDRQKREAVLKGMSKLKA
jgi:MoaA/NifB/PqqE/SkfB family radical SAM enzyme